MTAAPRPAITVELTTSGDGLALVRRFGTAAIDGMRIGLRRGLLRARDTATQSLLAEKKSGSPHVLARKIVFDVRDGADGLPYGVLGVARGLSDKYARIQELGTVGKGGLLPDIIPVQAKALAIPLPGAKDKLGVPLYSGPRDPQIAKKIFLIARKGKPAILAIHSDVTGQNQRRGRAGESIIPLFILLQKTSIRPKRYLRNAIEQTAPYIGESINRGIAAELAKKGGAP